ncbi:MAG: aspartate/tyrosine/aromatic aminotransferase [Chlamydiae bacterium]|nr:aspartate/tyrosine/aromatic aminotransferase [Chlamydiota bacterium]
MTLFKGIPVAPMDPIFGLGAAYNKDARDFKINLTVGVYKDEVLQTPVLESIKLTETILLKEELNKEYSLIEGDKEYLSLVGSLVFGSSFFEQNHMFISSFQTVGGTGALRIGGEFLKKVVCEEIHISDPSWPNHKGIFSEVGLLVKNYPYYDLNTNSLDFVQMRTYLKGLAPKSTVLFHTCCHNPSGADPSKHQWQELATICKERNLIPFFDSAYLGLGKTLGDDTYAIRLFASMGIEMLIAVSFSKNFSLYGERIGALYIYSNEIETAQKITSQIKTIIRRNYSNPPIHGMKIVKEILRNPSLRAIWEEELSLMRNRILEMKSLFVEKLSLRVKNKDFSYLEQTNGMFCFCGLEKSVVELLMKEYAIYMTHDGRINVAGLTKNTIDYVVDSIAKVLNRI